MTVSSHVHSPRSFHDRLCRCCIQSVVHHRVASCTQTPRGVCDRNLSFFSYCRNPFLVLNQLTGERLHRRATVAGSFSPQPIVCICSRPRPQSAAAFSFPKRPNLGRTRASSAGSLASFRGSRSLCCTVSSANRCTLYFCLSSPNFHRRNDGNSFEFRAFPSAHHRRPSAFSHRTGDCDRTCGNTSLCNLVDVKVYKEEKKNPYISTINSKVTSLLWQ